MTIAGSDSTDHSLAKQPATGAAPPLFWLALALTLLFSLTGLTGHDPWKQDEAYSFGLILNMVQSGDWVAPRLADDPFMEKPPVYYWTAAGLMTLLDGVLPAHDAARLATGLYLLLAIAALAGAARVLWGPPAGALAALIWISTLVVIQQGHYLITDTALTAGMAIGLLGLVLAGRRWLTGGLALGTGIGLSFLAKGLLGPGILGVTAVLLAVLPPFRGRCYWRALGVAMLAAAPWVLIWPGLLYLRDPNLFQLWFWDNNFGRFFGASGLGEPARPGFWLRTFPWVSFPAAPLALWTLWARRAEWRPGASLIAPALATITLALVGWLVLFTAGTARDLYALPLIAPLAVIAAGSVTRLSGWPRGIGYWISLLVFGGLAALLWFLWLYGAFFGAAPEWSILSRQLPLAHDFSRAPAAIASAALLTLAWAILLWRIRPPHGGGLLAWPAGVVLVWALVAWLHFPWIDQAKSYRAVFTELSHALPREFNCVSDLTEPESLRLRESERGMLHYFANVKIQHAEAPDQATCDFLLLEVQRRRHREGVSPGPGWTLIWQGQRPADRRDLFLLFQRDPATPSAKPAGTL